MADWSTASKTTRKPKPPNHQEELERAAIFLNEAIPGVEGRSYFVDFEGISRSVGGRWVE